MIKKVGTIRHEKILVAPEQEAGPPVVRLYRRTRSWPVGALALVAASGAVLTTGALSSALDGGPDAAFAARIAEGAASLRSGMEAHASTSTSTSTDPAPAAFAPPPGSAWQIQVGSFRNTRAAEAHLRALEQAVPRLAGLKAVHQLRGRFNRVRIGGIEEGPAARTLCAQIRSAGSGCFVVGPES